jgi:two-component system chemotaxis response regulator CheB
MIWWQRSVNICLVDALAGQNQTIVIKVFLNTEPELKFAIQTANITCERLDSGNIKENKFMNDSYKLLIVDDSKMMRNAIRGIFAADDRIQVAGEAADGEAALEIIPQIDPDVLTMDVNMPVMDGLTTLKHMMIETPKPTVMVSTLTQEGASLTFDALKFGAVDFVSKPSKLNESKLEGQEKTVARKVALAAQVEIEAIRYIRDVPKGESSRPSRQVACDRFIAIGAAEGGYGALLKVVPHLRPELPATYLAVIHAASQHVDAFARYLDDSSSIRVKRAIDGLPVEGGICYLGAGEEYITIQSHNSGLFLQVQPAPFKSMSERRGSINMLMFSAAEVMGNRAVGIVLSGAGNDGAEGMAEIIRSGGKTLIQDPKSCLYKEMAKSALEKCELDGVIPDIRIASAVNNFLFNGNRIHSRAD